MLPKNNGKKYYLTVEKYVHLTINSARLPDDSFTIFQTAWRILRQDFPNFPVSRIKIKRGEAFYPPSFNRL